MPLVRYEFVAAGPDQVKAAFRGITAEAQASARAAQASQAATIRATRATSGNAAANEKTKALAYVARIRDKHFADEQRAAEASAKRIAAAESRIHNAALRDRERAERAARRNREIGEQTTQRAIERAQLRAQQDRTKFRSDVSGAVLRGAGGVAAGAGAAVLGATIAATRDAMRVQELANRVSINARKSGQAFIDPRSLRREWEQTAQQNPGQTAEGVGQAVQKFIAMTGDIESARRGQGVFATVASATGADITSVAATSASMADKFGIKSQEDMKEVLAALTFQGKEGAFELSDAAQYFQEMASAASSFGMGKGVQSVKTLGGLAQIARGENGSGAEASTSVERMFTQLKLGAAGLKKDTGVDIYRDGQTRDITELLPEIIAKVGGSDIAKKQTGLQQLFDTKGFQAVAPLTRAYNEAYRSASGTDDERMKAGMAAVTEVINKATNAAGSWKDVVIDASRAQQDSSARITAAWERVVAVAADELLPAVLPIINDLTRFNGVLGSSITEFGLFLRGLRQTLEFFGLIKPQTPAEKLAEAKGKLAEFDAANEGILDTPEALRSPETRKAIEEREKLVARVQENEAGTKFTVGTGVKDFDDFNKRLKDVGGVMTGGDPVEAQHLYDLVKKDPAKARERLMAGEYPSLTPEGKRAGMALIAQQEASVGGAVDAPAERGAMQAADAFGRVVGTLSDLTNPIGTLKLAIEAAAKAGKPNVLGGPI